jgi:hypothetical protein
VDCRGFTSFRARSGAGPELWSPPSVHAGLTEAACLATMCRLEELDTIIADEAALNQRETVDALAQAGVELVIA